MGRVEHLTRLGLGLSAFQPLQAPSPSDDVRTATGGKSQQYDAKGRPKNPLAEEHNAKQRYAQNEVLELAHVVERKHGPVPRKHANGLLHMHDCRDHAKLDMITEGVLMLLTWYPQTLFERSLLGLYDSETSLTQIIAEDVMKVRLGSASDAFIVLLPGFGFCTTNAILADLTSNAIDKFVALAANHVDFTTIEAATGSIQLATELCLQPLAHLALSARLGLVQPRGIASAASMLAGFYHLYATSLAHHDQSIRSTISVLSILLSLRRDGTADFVQHTLRSHNHHAWTRTRSVHAGLSMVQFIHETLRPVKVRILGSDDPLRSRHAYHQDVAFEPIACESCHHSQATRSVRPKILAGIAMTVLRRLMQLPLELITIQCSARAFEMIVGPVQNSGTVSEIPTNHIFGFSHVMGKTAILSLISKVGLALGFTLVVQTAWHAACSAIETFHELQTRHKRSYGRS